MTEMCDCGHSHSGRCRVDGCLCNTPYQRFVNRKEKWVPVAEATPLRSNNRALRGRAHPEHSDHANADYAESVTYARGGGKWVPQFRFDARGYACGPVTWLPPEDGSFTRFLAVMDLCAERYPPPTADIVLANGWGWVVDDSGTEIVAVELRQWMQEQQRAAA